MLVCRPERKTSEEERTVKILRHPRWRCTASSQASEHWAFSPEKGTPGFITFIASCSGSLSESPSRQRETLLFSCFTQPTRARVGRVKTFLEFLHIGFQSCMSPRQVEGEPGAHCSGRREVTRALREAGAAHSTPETVHRWAGLPRGRARSRRRAPHISRGCSWRRCS